MIQLKERKKKQMEKNGKLLLSAELEVSADKMVNDPKFTFGCKVLFGAIDTTSAYSHRLVTSYLSGLYVAMPVFPMAKIRLYFPFHECFVTK